MCYIYNGQSERENKIAPSSSPFSFAKETANAGEVAESLADVYENERREQQELLQRKIDKAKNHLETLERMTTKAYEDLLTNTITEPMFDSLVERTKKESEDLMKQIAHDERRLAKNGKQDGNARKRIDLIKDYMERQKSLVAMLMTSQMQFALL